MMLANKLMGASAPSDKLYIEDVFSTWLYNGNGGSQDINNGIALGDGPANGTVLHLTGDTLTDSSPVTKAVTVVSASVNTTTKKYGTGSIEFNGSNSYLDIPGALPGGLSGDFTIECWINFSSATAWTPVIETRADDGTTSGVYFYLTPAGAFGVYPFGSGGAVPTNTWTHLAATRSGSTLRTFINGSLIGTFTADPASYPYGGQDVKVNRWIGGSGRYFNGLIDDLRITKGRALYTANFTPPTAALPLDTLVVGKGGITWTKCRSFATNHNITGAFLGGPNKRLITNATGGSNTFDGTTTNGIVPTASGFQIVNNASDDFNGTGRTYTSWTFAEAPKFFRVVTWTGNGVAGRQILHGLGSVPGCIIVKATGSTTQDWAVYHQSQGSTKVGSLNSTSAFTTGGSGYWNNTNPTSTVFTVGNDIAVNQNNQTYVALVFAHDPSADGVIQCGSFTTDANGGVSLQTLGWEPQFIIWKRANSAEDWRLLDSMRGMPVGNNYAASACLYPNQAGAEALSDYFIASATGFSLPSGSFGGNSQYVYMVIRRGPMRAPTDATKVFNVLAITDGQYGTASPTNINFGFPTDLYIQKQRTSVYDGSGGPGRVVSRLRGTMGLMTTAINAEAAMDINNWASMTGPNVNYNGQFYFYNTAAGERSHVHYGFRRAPKFFQEVCYTGTGVVRTVDHGLEVPPELMIIKERSTTTNWPVYFGDATTHLILNNDSAASAGSDRWNSTPPTDKVFTVSGRSQVNYAGATYTALLFASCPGVSKIGNYIGDGTTGRVMDCGFSNGARFLLLKRTDDISGWFLWDSARGITSGNDPWLLLNLTNAENAATDYIDPVASGFALNEFNQTGFKFFYLAIA